MKNVGMRLLGLVLLPLTPVVAAWAMYVFRNSDNPEDRSYLFNLRELAKEAWNLLLTGESIGDEEEEEED